jgi:hypothetical protein
LSYYFDVISFIKFRVISETINTNTKLLSHMHIRIGNIIKELQKLSSKSIRDISEVSHKVDIILANLKMIVNANTAKEIEQHPLKFAKPVTPPWKTTKDRNDPNLYTEAELCMQRDNIFKQLSEEHMKNKKSHGPQTRKQGESKTHPSVFM